VRAIAQRNTSRFSPVVENRGRAAMAPQRGIPDESRRGLHLSLDPAGRTNDTYRYIAIG